MLIGGENKCEGSCLRAQLCTLQNSVMTLVCQSITWERTIQGVHSWKWRRIASKRPWSFFIGIWGISWKTKVMSGAIFFFMTIYMKKGFVPYLYPHFQTSVLRWSRASLRRGLAVPGLPWQYFCRSSYVHDGRRALSWRMWMGMAHGSKNHTFFGSIFRPLIWGLR